MRPGIQKNAARCRRCGDVIQSGHTHDFRWCRCGAIAVDGGHAYLARTGRPEDCEELSVCLHAPAAGFQDRCRFCGQNVAKPQVGDHD